jgi:protein-disulfide isomerase
VAKVQRKVIKRGRQQNASTGMILLVIGGAVIVVAVIIALASGVFKPKTALATDPTGLSLCGNIPCPIKGDPNAPVIMIEVSDYDCSHCRDYSRDIEPKLEEQYIKTGKVRYIVHSFGFGPDTQAIAAASLCAGDQGKFFEYHALLFKNQGAFDSNSLASYAQQVGIDAQAFATCVNSGKHRADVDASSKAVVAAGVNSTPSFFINGKLVVGALPINEFQSLIEAALKSK